MSQTPGKQPTFATAQAAFEKALKTNLQSDWETALQESRQNPQRTYQYPERSSAMIFDCLLHLGQYDQ